MSADVTIEYTVKVSYMEIYMERIKDLLARMFHLFMLRGGETDGVSAK